MGQAMAEEQSRERIDAAAEMKLKKSCDRILGGQPLPKLALCDSSPIEAVQVLAVQVLMDESREFRSVSLKGFNGGLQHGGLLHVFPSDVEARGARQMAHKFALRPAVSFPKRMQRVQFTEIVCRSDAELRGAESGEVFFVPEPIEDRVGGAHKVSMMGEQVSILADIDRPLPISIVRNSTGPFVNVTKQVAVNGLQLGEVEQALKRRPRKLVRACRNKRRFGLLERGGVGYA
jgi:hypothetical protein